jgi:hypothetical protein
VSSSRHKLLQILAQQPGMSYGSCCEAGDMLKLFPYAVHVIQQLLLHCEKHQYCELFHAKAEDDLLVLDVTFF